MIALPWDGFIGLRFNTVVNHNLASWHRFSFINALEICMSQLILELKKEHGQIAGILNEVSKLGISSKEGQQKLMDAKLGLLAHLKKEDDKLYPVLKRAAESDPDLKQTLDIYAKDMAGISKAAIDFFTKYANGGSGMEFAKDMAGLFSTLKTRIRKEEDVLYKEYDRLNP